jgi:uncharacterized coiled-coil protein SlyX
LTASAREIHKLLCKPDLVERLTKTESIIIAEYLSRSPPPRAKDLAAELGVSIKTVYKALYKYRKLKGLQNLASATTQEATSEPGDHDEKSLIEAIYELKHSVDRLNEHLRILIELLSKREVSMIRDVNVSDNLPQFVKDNPWLEIVGNLDAREG